MTIPLLTDQEYLQALNEIGFNARQQNYLLSHRKLVRREDAVFFAETIASGWPGITDKELYTFCTRMCPKGEDETTYPRSLLGIEVYCMLLPLSRQTYLDKGYPESLWHNTIPDILWHLHEEPDGRLWLDTVPPVYSSDWHFHILKANVIQLGRLQFQKLDAPIACETLNISKGAPVLNIHIPACGPLDTNACRASLKQAREFFATYEPDYPYQAFYCYSWLLDPVFNQYLPESSRILQFQKLGTVLPPEKPSNDALLRVFRFGTESIEAPRTTMQKALAQMVHNGIPFGLGHMFIPRDSLGDHSTASVGCPGRKARG